MASEKRFAERILEMLLRYRKTRWFRVTYLLLLGFIVGLLYFLASSALACLVIILMPTLVFIVPYFFGERKGRRLAVNALPVFLIAILFATALQTQFLLAQPQAIPRQSFPGIESSPTMALSNGTVTPYHADPSTPFTFRVKVTTTVNGTPMNYKVYLNLTVISSLSFVKLPATAMAPSPGNATTNTRNGTWYETRLNNLTDAIYVYGFSVNKGANWTISNLDFGPFTASWGTLYVLILYFTGTSMTLPLIFYFLILFLWWYTTRARQMRTRDLGGTIEIPKEKPAPKAEPAEKATKAAAFTCTNCGADVRDEDEKCPKCGAVFEE